GNAASSATAVPVGGLSYKVDYAGDSSYDPAASDCESLTAEQQQSPADQILDLKHHVESSSIDDNAKKQLVNRLDNAWEALTGVPPAAQGASLRALATKLVGKLRGTAWRSHDASHGAKKCRSGHAGAPDEPDVKTACRELSFFVRDVTRYAS